MKLTTDLSCKKISLKGVADYLKRHNNYLILCHASPDGDTLGAGFALGMALKAMGKRCYIKCADPIPPRYDYFVDKSLLKPAKTDYILAVDIADKQLLGSLCEEYGDRIDLCIDHHVSNTRYAKNLYLDADASATCESMFMLIKKLKVKLTDKMAAALYTGIATDTGSFKYSNVTAKTHRIVAELYRYNIEASEICRLMFDTKSRNRLDLERMVLESAEFHFNDRCILLTVTSDMLKTTGCGDDDMEGIAVISRSVEGVLAGVSIKQKDADSYKISLRTYEPLDASKICKELGGGGHRGAAGCTLKGDLSEVKAKLLEVIGKALEEKDAGTSAT